MMMQSLAAEIAFNVGPIEGTLLKPEGSSNLPVALLIAGSGPTDRDGNGPGATPANLKKIAVALAARGIASLRYDKRGAGPGGWKAEFGAPEDFRFNHYVDDAVSLIAALRQRNEFSSVIIVGHSEGALVGTLAAGRSKVDGLVLLTATSRRQGDLLKEQLQHQVPADTLKPIADAIDRLMDGQVVDPPPGGLHIPPVMQPAFASAFREDSLPPLKALQLPILIVNGGQDKQVRRIDFDQLRAAAINSTALWLDTMNHVLVDVGGDADNALAYTQQDRPLNGEAVEAIVAFIRSNTKRGRN